MNKLLLLLLLLTRHACDNGRTNTINIPEALKSHWSYRSEFSIINGLLLKGKHIVVPAAMRLDILEKLHTGHLGITKCRERAMSSAWWPGLNKQLHDMIYMCCVSVLRKG